DQVDAADRVEEAAITSLAATSTGDAASLLVGLAVVVAVVYAVTRRDWRALIAAGALLAARTVDGFGFVPGFLVAAPLAGAGLAVAWRRGPPARTAMVIAVVSLPLVWTFQFAEGARPQWGGRYVLLSGLLLTVVAVAELLSASAPLRRAAFAITATVTALGFGWMIQRTHAFADVAHRLDARGEPVLISRVGHLVREGGGVHDLNRWLTAVSNADLQKAGAVAAASGAQRIAVVDIDGRVTPARVGEYVSDGQSRTIKFLPGAKLRVTVYER
ncbi:MAG TPA: hypothetical protein VNB24_05805, partial [Acidimicrobiales bacterium]|nr:hypothetical protein [Acidimicrobiales bacterium]